MRELDAVLIAHEQAALGQPAEQVQHRLPVTAVPGEVLGPTLPAHRRRARWEGDEPEERGPHERFLVGQQRPDRRLRQLGQRSRHATALDVGLERQPVALTLAPHLLERHREQRQGVRLVLDVQRDLVHQPGFERDAAVPRGLLDHVAQTIPVDRRQEVVAGADRSGERRQLRELVQVVRTQRDDDAGAVGAVGGQRREVVPEGLASGFVLASGEELLELVDDHEQAGPLVEAAQDGQDRSREHPRVVLRLVDGVEREAER